MNRPASLIWLIARWAILITVLVAIYLPLVMIIVYSFSSSQSVGGNFGNFTFSLYSGLFKNEKLLDATKNTLIIGFAFSSAVSMRCCNSFISALVANVIFLFIILLYKII